MKKLDYSNLFMDSNGLYTLQKNEFNVALFGPVGVGKTSVVNKLTNNDFETTSHGFSCTRNIQYAPSASNNMFLIDFPGLNATVDIAKHLKIQKHGLSSIPLRAMGICVKYDKYDIMLKFINQAVKIMKHHIENLFIIITHCENIDKDNEEYRINEICELIKHRFGINRVITTTLDTEEKTISDKIYGFAKNMKNLKFKTIENAEIYKQCDVDVDFQFEDYHDKYLSMFKKIFEKIRIEYSRTDDKELKRALYFTLTEYRDETAKKLVKEIMTDFEKDNSSEESCDDGLNIAITQNIVFINSISHLIRDFKTVVEQNLEIQSVNYANNSNEYRQCIKCGEIWFRVYGCEDIICGNRSDSKDNLTGTFHNYNIKITNDENISITRNIQIIDKNDKDFKFTENNTIYDIIFSNLFSSSKKSSKSDNKNVKPKGCGKKMKWTEMKNVTSEVLNKLKEISITQDYNTVDDYIKKLKF